MKHAKKLLFAPLFALLALALAFAFAAPARAEDFDDPDADNAILGESGGFQVADIPDSDYEGGSIPRMDITFRDTVDPETGEPLTGDEVIDLVNRSEDHSYKATEVSVSITVPPTYDNPEDDLWDGISGYTGETDLELEFIRGRGNSTWQKEKKPYKLKFDSKVDLFGMGKNKHWGLIANYFDQSLTIDRLIGWLGDAMGTLGFTPRGVPVDLYLNGKYYGSYVLMEEVRVDTNRVEIDEVDEDEDDLSSLAITGDYLLGINRKPTARIYEFFTTSRGHAYTYDTPEYGPEPTAAGQVQQQYLKQHMDRVEDAVYTQDLVSPAGESAWDFIDMTTLADYWWIQEFTTNVDGWATPSTYAYKLRDTVAADGTVTVGKLYWGPLWDFDFVWGQINEEGFNNVQAEWVSYLRQDPEFVAYLKERWAVLDSKLEEITREGGLLDAYIAEMQESWDANRELWPTEDHHGWDYSSFKGAIDSLRDAIEARRAWINGHLDELQTTYWRVSFEQDGTELYSQLVLDGEPLLVNEPEIDVPADKLFEGWFTEDGVEYVAEEAVHADAVYYPVLVDASSVTQATEIYFPQGEIWTRRGASIAYEILPADARDKRIEWSSSNEDLIIVRDGYAIADDLPDGVDQAEVIVTARLVGSGAEASIRVVVYRVFGTVPEPDSITFDEAVELEVGEYTPLRYTTEPEVTTLNEEFDLLFEVADESVATVSRYGVVTGVAPGTTTVTVLRQSRETWLYEPVAEIEVTVGEPAVEPETFAITFDLGGGTIDGDAGPLVWMCEKGEVITMPEAPVRDGYTFVCWRGSEYQPGDEYTVEGEHTFTAEWEKNASPQPGGDQPGGDTTPQGGGDAAPQGGRGGNNVPRTGEAAPVTPALAGLACVVCAAGALVKRRLYTT